MSNASVSRVDGRSQSQIRPIRILANTSPYAEGSAEVLIGATRLLITASIDPSGENSDGSLGQTGGIVASLQMLPRATHVRIRNPLVREALQQELRSIQELVVRSLRAATTPSQLQNCTITLDVSVICADGGIATAAVAGAWVALAQALSWASAQRVLAADLKITPVAALSSGLIDGHWCIDLSAEEASTAESIVNMVFDQNGLLLDLKATRETGAMEVEKLSSLLEMASKHVGLIFDEQLRALRDEN